MAGLPAPDLRDPVVFAERQLFQSVLQYPSLFAESGIEDWQPEAISAPAHRAVLDAIREVGLRPDLSLGGWHALLGEAASLTVRGLIAELAVAPVPVVLEASSGLPPRAYTDSLVARVRERQVSREIADGMATMRRLGTDPKADQAELRALSVRLQDLERQRAAIRDGLTR